MMGISQSGTAKPRVASCWKGNVGRPVLNILPAATALDGGGLRSAARTLVALERLLGRWPGSKFF
jgi:hypothetical protein